jgi:hypothetical protein
MLSRLRSGKNDFEEEGAQARPPENDVGAGLDGAAVSSQQHRGSVHEVNELLLADVWILNNLHLAQCLLRLETSLCSAREIQLTQGFLTKPG